MIPTWEKEETSEKEEEPYKESESICTLYRADPA